jgi:hypothetical protein
MAQHFYDYVAAADNVDGVDDDDEDSSNNNSKNNNKHNIRNDKQEQ